MEGFKRFLLRGSLVEVAVALVIALAFADLINRVIDTVINPLLAAIAPGTAMGLGFLLREGNPNTFGNIGALIGAIIAFVALVAVVYVAIVVPYRSYQARHGRSAFPEPEPTKTCPACLQDDLPTEATKCWHCTTDQPAVAA